MMIINSSSHCKHAPLNESLFVDFTEVGFLRRLKALSAARGLISRACALRGAKDLRLFDATAGYGVDGVSAAIRGASVTMAERCPEVASVLEERLNKAREFGPLWLREALQKVTLFCGDSLEYLRKVPPDMQPHVILIDPMFPEVGRTSLSTKSIELLRQYCGDDLDAPELFEMASKVALKRVVVKRRAKAPLITNLKPSFSVKGTTIRFDVYLTNNE